jgi:Epoxide hydrolase N terminus
MQTRPEPFTLNISDRAIADLGERLERLQPLMSRSHGGTALPSRGAAAARLVSHWRSRFDWRSAEARLNGFGQYRVAIDGVDCHFLHVPGRGPDPTPLVLLHPLPGSLFDVLDLIPGLTDPARFGADPADAFTVVAPSFPGNGWPPETGLPFFGQIDTQRLIVTLMTDILGYPRFAAPGGVLRRACGGDCGLYRVLLDALRATRGTEPSTREAGALARRPGPSSRSAAPIIVGGQAPGDGEPVGQATLDALSRDDLIAGVSLAWFTGAVAVTSGPMASREAGFGRDRQTGLSIASRGLGDLRHWTVVERGEPAAPTQEPEAFLAGLRAFFRPLRERPQNAA